MRVLLPILLVLAMAAQSQANFRQIAIIIEGHEAWNAGSTALIKEHSRGLSRNLTSFASSAEASVYLLNEGGHTLLVDGVEMPKAEFRKVVKDLEPTGQGFFSASLVGLLKELQAEPDHLQVVYLAPAAGCASEADLAAFAEAVKPFADRFWVALPGANEACETLRDTLKTHISTWAGHGPTMAIEKLLKNWHFLTVFGGSALVKVQDVDGETPTLPVTALHQSDARYNNDFVANRPMMLTAWNYRFILGTTPPVDQRMLVQSDKQSTVDFGQLGRLTVTGEGEATIKLKDSEHEATIRSGETYDAPPGELVVTKGERTKTLTLKPGETKALALP